MKGNLSGEVENITSGVVERKVPEEQDKAVALASSQVTPDENGYIALSKQDAFLASSMQAAPVETTEELNLGGETETLDLGVEAEDATKSIPAAQQTETLTQEPVDTASTASLSGLNLDFDLSNISLVTDKDEAQQPVEGEDAVKEVALPETQEKVVAEEPQGVDNNLFINNQKQGTEEKIAEEVQEGETGELNAQAAVTVEQGTLEGNNEVQLGTLETATTTVADQATTTVADQATTTVADQTATTATDTQEVKQELEPVDKPVEGIIPEFAVKAEEGSGESGEEEEHEEEPSEGYSIQSDSDEDMLYNKLCDIDGKLDIIIGSLKREQEEEKQEDKEANKVTELPQEVDIPTFGAPADSNPFGVTVEADVKEDDSVDALSLIGDNPEDQELDETEIRGDFNDGGESYGPPRGTFV